MTIQKNIKKPELMSPVKDWAGLEACKNYADAVYFGVNELSLRARANTLKSKDLIPFISQVHYYGLKAYLTLNSTIYNQDIKKAEKLLQKAKNAMTDAVIVWDPSIIELCRKMNIDFIISTQANISNWQSAQFYEKLGARRIVLAREMSLQQIKELRQKTKIEIEVFVHGAMCVSISGRCLLSAYLYGQSSNCGACAQPCRKEWILSDNEGNQVSNFGKYFLSAKDLCMIEFIPDLIKAGVNAFKIEGRLRDPKYIEVTSRCYREAIDSYFNHTFIREKVLKWKQDLSAVYNRGFSTGFYFGTPGKEGIGFDKADNYSPVKKIYIGDIIHYYPRVKAGSLILSHCGLKVGDKIIIQGAHTFLEQTILKMQIQNRDVKRGKKGEEVAIQLKDKVREHDKLFLIK
ncbi:MAG TPA: peptidase U32 family protein [Candidatus Paceibacterota bacterium]|jgi:putative protease|nr:peptidase U32 family protein [Candidatus Pacearchaeota archaeon]HRR94608.1 peptidase U32 family protein [Candidatus Paceibacterota bacterium]HRU20692.1 peptidase U32 family protein [Candidatus Paceibacterota bacterium]